MDLLEVKDFTRDVIERSSTIPVLVDFWAEWCGPCRVLGPILERVVTKFPDRVVLAKLDTDRNPEISAQYAIRSIPAVKLFVDGRVKDEFIGALPEAAVMRWLEKALPERMQKELDQATAFLAAGDNASAEQIARRVLEQEPDSEHAAAIAAQAIVWQAPARAAEIVRNIEEHSEYYPPVEAIRTVARLNALIQDSSSLPDAPAKKAYLTALHALAGGDFEAAVTGLIDVIRTGREYDDDGARKACIAIFRLLGDEHSVTRSHRREFSSALNS